MGYDGSLKFDTEISEKGFNSGIKKLGGIAKTGISVVAGAIGGVTAALGAGAVAGIKYNATIEQYQTSFEVMTGSAEKAASVIENLKKVGAETPFELNDLADTTQLLMNYGFTADDAMDKMMMLGDISQGSADKMQRIAMAYGQMSSAGRVSLEDIKQMIEAGFNPLQEISETTGETMDSLYNRISKGTITVDEITASMQRATSEGGKYFQSMEKQSQTVNGLISTLKDNAQQLLGEVVKPITESIAKELLPSAIGAIEQLTTAFENNGVDGLIEAGSQVVTNLILGISKRLPSIIDTAVQIIQAFITNVNANLSQLLTAGSQILASLISGIVQLLPSLGELAINIVTQMAEGITQNAPQMIPKGVEILTGFISGVVDNLPKLLDIGLAMIMAIAEGLINSLPTLIEQVPKIINAIFDTIDSFLPKILFAGAKLIVELGKGIIKSIPVIVANFGEIVKAIFNIIMHVSLFSQGSKLIKGLGDGLKSCFGWVKTLIQNLINLIKNPFKIDWSSIGKNIITGIANGIKGAVGSLVRAAKNAAKSALNAAKRFLGIHSPSTVFRDQVGKYMAEGMGVGFERNIPTVEMSKSISNSVQDMQKKAVAITARPAATTAHNQFSHVNSNMGGNTEAFDYERMGKETAKAMEGMGVYMDSRPVGKMVTSVVNDELGKIERRKT